MELFRQLIKRITAWQHTKRVSGTSIQEDENIFLATMDDEFLIFKRTHVREFTNLKNGYSVYLVNEEEI